MEFLIKINIFGNVEFLKYDEGNGNFPFILLKDENKATIFETKEEAEKMIKKYKKEAGTFFGETFIIEEVLNDEKEN